MLTPLNFSSYTHLSSALCFFSHSCSGADSSASRSRCLHIMLFAFILAPLTSMIMAAVLCRPSSSVRCWYNGFITSSHRPRYLPACTWSYVIPMCRSAFSNSASVTPCSRCLSVMCMHGTVSSCPSACCAVAIKLPHLTHTYSLASLATRRSVILLVISASCRRPPILSSHCRCHSPSLLLTPSTIDMLVTITPFLLAKWVISHSTCCSNSLAWLFIMLILLHPFVLPSQVGVSSNVSSPLFALRHHVTCAPMRLAAIRTSHLILLLMSLHSCVLTSSLRLNVTYACAEICSCSLASVLRCTALAVVTLPFSSSHLVCILRPCRCVLSSSSDIAAMSLAFCSALTSAVSAYCTSGCFISISTTSSPVSAGTIAWLHVMSLPLPNASGVTDLSVRMARHFSSMAHFLFVGLPSIVVLISITMCIVLLILSSTCMYLAMFIIPLNLVDMRCACISLLVIAPVSVVLPARLHSRCSILMHAARNALIKCSGLISGMSAFSVVTLSCASHAAAASLLVSWMHFSAFARTQLTLPPSVSVALVWWVGSGVFASADDVALYVLLVSHGCVSLLLTLVVVLSILHL